ncbi:MAG: hypothetical protein IVW36_09815 [Dehalococcoidia bacterium]|nr:hypothetical protein [Dehalococcoidia bacterium]
MPLGARRFVSPHLLRRQCPTSSSASVLASGRRSSAGVAGQQFQEWQMREMSDAARAGRSRSPVAVVGAVRRSLQRAQLPLDLGARSFPSGVPAAVAARAGGLDLPHADGSRAFA